MEPVILRVAHSVEIDAPPASVFAFVSDAAAKARLNPSVQVIRIERQTPGPLREGTVTFFRVQKGRRIFEYRTRCLRVIPGRLIEGEAELPTLFRVRVEVEATARGARLTQHEECEVTLDMLEALLLSRRAQRTWRMVKLLHLFMPALGREAYAVLLKERTAALRLALTGELQAWLEAIKHHLEMDESERQGPTLHATGG